jgi:hypothetical protein
VAAALYGPVVWRDLPSLLSSPVVGSGVANPSAASARRSSGVAVDPSLGVKEGREGRWAGSGITPNLSERSPDDDEAVVSDPARSFPFPAGVAPVGDPLRISSRRTASCSGVNGGSASSPVGVAVSPSVAIMDLRELEWSRGEKRRGEAGGVGGRGSGEGCLRLAISRNRRKRALGKKSVEFLR